MKKRVRASGFRARARPGAIPTTIRPLPTVDDVAVGEAVAAVEAVQDVDRDLDLVLVAHVEAQRQNGRVLKGAQKGEEN